MSPYTEKEKKVFNELLYTVIYKSNLKVKIVKLCGEAKV
jgi:hypothetical protein